MAVIGLVPIYQRPRTTIPHAIGQIQVSDSEQLHFRPMLVSVNVEFDSRDERLPVEQRRRQNKIKGYSAATTSRTTAPAPTAAPPQVPRPAPAAAPPPSATQSTAPWRRTG
jgi:hypothetical protein